MKKKLNQEENFKKFIIDSYKFLIQKKSVLGTHKNLVLNLLQNEIHLLLNSFLNGSLLVQRSQYLYPWIKIYQKKKIIKFLEKIILCLNVLSNTENPKLKQRILKLKRYTLLNKYNAKILSEIISFLYVLFDELISESGKTDKKNIKCTNEFLIEKYNRIDNGYLKPLLKLRQYIIKHLQNYVHSAFLHGSLSTLDYVRGASDLDILLILKKSIVLNAQKLFEFEKKVVRSLKFFYQIDPLQHHGYMIITEIDMQYYPQTYFPFILFKYATRLTGPEEMIFFERDSSLERKKLIWDMINDNKTQLKMAITNLYGLKYLLSKIQLIPTIYLQSLDEFYYKRDSFKRLKELNGIDFLILDKATFIRNNWSYRDMKISKIMAQFIPNPFFIALWFRKLHKEIPDHIHQVLEENFIDEYLEFCNSLRRKINIA